MNTWVILCQCYQTKYLRGARTRRILRPFFLLADGVVLLLFALSRLRPRLARPKRGEHLLHSSLFNEKPAGIKCITVVPTASAQTNVHHV
jgi:hypothetical protein